MLKGKKIPGRVPVPGVAWVDKKSLLAVAKKQRKKPGPVPQKKVTRATVYVVWRPKQKYAAFLAGGGSPQQLKGLRKGVSPDRILQQRHIRLDQGVKPEKLAEYIHANRQVLIPESETSGKVEYLGLVAALPRSGTTEKRLHKFLSAQAKKAWATRGRRGRRGRTAFFEELSRD